MSVLAREAVSKPPIPAYQKAGFKVKGVYDINPSRASQMAQKFEVPQSTNRGSQGGK